MRLEQQAISTQNLLENLGYCRFSAFFPHASDHRKALIEMTARFVVGVFAAFSVYDLLTKKLPFAAKVAVHGTMMSLITSLCLSLLLKRFLPAAKEQSPEKVQTPEPKEAVTVPKAADETLQSRENIKRMTPVSPPLPPLRLPIHKVPPTAGRQPYKFPDSPDRDSFEERGRISLDSPHTYAKVRRKLIFDFERSELDEKENSV